MRMASDSACVHTTCSACRHGSLGTVCMQGVWLWHSDGSLWHRQPDWAADQQHAFRGSYSVHRCQRAAGVHCSCPAAGASNGVGNWRHRESRHHIPRITQSSKPTPTPFLLLRSGVGSTQLTGAGTTATAAGQVKNGCVGACVRAAHPAALTVADAPHSELMDPLPMQ